MSHHTAHAARRLLLAVTLPIAVSVLLTACQTPPQSAEQPAEQPTASIDAMSPEQKRAEIGEDFPVEVPVPAGEVERGRQQGADAWDYVVVVQTSPDSLAEWYRTAYAGRNWVVASDTQVEKADGPGGRELTFRKGDAESQVFVTGDDGGARAETIVGVGAPVLGTQ